MHVLCSRVARWDRYDGGDDNVGEGVQRRRFATSAVTGTFRVAAVYFNLEGSGRFQARGGFEDDARVATTLSDEESVAPRDGRTVVGVVSALLSLIVVASCTGGTRWDGARSRETLRAAVTPPRAYRNVAVIRDDDSIVSVCRPANVARRLIRFSRGLRNARETALRRFWGAGFEWFSVGGRSSIGNAKWHFVAYRSRKALRYVQDQHGLNLRVDELEVALRPGSRGADVVYAGRWMGAARDEQTAG